MTHNKLNYQMRAIESIQYQAALALLLELGKEQILAKSMKSLAGNHSTTEGGTDVPPNFSKL